MPTAQKSRIETVDHNTTQEDKAIKAFLGEVHRFLNNNLAGAVGVRVSIQNNRLGNVRAIVEQEA